MPPSSIIESNNKVSLRGQRVVVSGATQGIGLGVALRFAKAGADVWIIGRNRVSGQAALDKLKQAAPSDTEPDFRFFQADLSVLADNERVANEVAEAAGVGGVDYLLETQGGPADRDDIAPNADGFDTHFAVQVVSRFVLAYRLTISEPVVKRAVVAIAGAGVGRASFDAEDITLEKLKKNGSYGMLAAGIRDCTVIDSLWQELAQRAPSVRFLHLHPGMVKTQALGSANIAAIWKSISRLFEVFVGTTPEEYAHIPFFLVANPDGVQRVGSEAAASQWWYNGKRISPSPASKREEVRKAVWEFMVGKLEQAAGGDSKQPQA